MGKTAILGCGVVGSGVAELLCGCGPDCNKPADPAVQLAYILDLRRPPAPLDTYWVQDYNQILEDAEVTVVVETMGGVGAALDFTRRALQKGKSVVTSNKELVATYGAELLALAEAQGVSYRFEASVGGGIPILRPLAECMAANEILEICGILNGTTNYIFSRMIQGGLSFAAALAEAQKLGYAEQDPTADIQGHDSCRKLAILTSIAQGWHLLPEQIPTEGIERVSLRDVDYAAAGGYRVKLLGRSLRQAGRVSACVAPCLVPLAHPLAGVDGVFNAVMLRGSATGEVMFYGKGAGKLPTASAVVADVLAIEWGRRPGSYGLWAANRPEEIDDPAGQKSPWYVRGSAPAPAGVRLLPPPQGAGDDVAFLTEPMTQDELVSLLGAGAAEALCLRVLD